MKTELNKNASDYLNSAKSKSGYPLHEDMNRVWFCGWVTRDGMIAFSIKDDRNSVHLYKCCNEYYEDTGKDSCYIEFPLSDTQLDIITDVCKSDDPLAVYACIHAFSSDDFLVPDDHEERWERIIKKIEPKEKNET